MSLSELDVEFCADDYFDEIQYQYFLDQGRIKEVDKLSNLCQSVIN